MQRVERAAGAHIAWFGSYITASDVHSLHTLRNRTFIPHTTSYCLGGKHRPCDPSLHILHAPHYFILPTVSYSSPETVAAAASKEPKEVARVPQTNLNMHIRSSIVYIVALLLLLPLYKKYAFSLDVCTCPR